MFHSSTCGRKDADSLFSSEKGVCVGRSVCVYRHICVRICLYRVHSWFNSSTFLIGNETWILPEDEGKVILPLWASNMLMSGGIKLLLQDITFSAWLSSAWWERMLQPLPKATTAHLLCSCSHQSQQSVLSLAKRDNLVLIPSGGGAGKELSFRCLLHRCLAHRRLLPQALDSHRECGEGRYRGWSHTLAQGQCHLFMGTGKITQSHCPELRAEGHVSGSCPVPQGWAWSHGQCSDDCRVSVWFSLSLIPRWDSAIPGICLISFWLKLIWNRN